MLFASVSRVLIQNAFFSFRRCEDCRPVACCSLFVLCPVRFLNFKIIASVTLFLKDNTDILKLLCQYVNVCVLRELYTYSQTPVEEGAGLPRLCASLLCFSAAGQRLGLVGSLNFELRRCCFFCYYKKGEQLLLEDSFKKVLFHH